MIREVNALVLLYRSHREWAYFTFACAYRANGRYSCLNRQPGSRHSWALRYGIINILDDVAERFRRNELHIKSRASPARSLLWRRIFIFD